ncbi:MAG: 2-C-methyl-D-erythritol 2,4-cyclodiphosphate synthase [Candidatus Omnitrophota bacterium]
MKIGIGYDIHRTSKNRKLILGGVAIASEKGLLGHSDADVLTHAICDALLGALGEPDIGEQFPDTDPRYRGISSMILLRNVHSLVRKKGYEINNIDSTVLLEKPKLFLFKENIRTCIAKTLDLPYRSVNVKAKTNEGLGDIGRGNAIAAYAVITIKKLKTKM